MFSLLLKCLREEKIQSEDFMMLPLCGPRGKAMLGLEPGEDVSDRNLMALLV